MYMTQLGMRIYIKVFLYHMHPESGNFESLYPASW